MCLLLTICLSWQSKSLQLNNEILHWTSDQKSNWNFFHFEYQLLCSTVLFLSLFTSLVTTDTNFYQFKSALSNISVSSNYFDLRYKRNSGSIGLIISFWKSYVEVVDGSSVANFVWLFQDWAKLKFSASPFTKISHLPICLRHNLFVLSNV